MNIIKEDSLSVSSNCSFNCFFLQYFYPTLACPMTFHLKPNYVFSILFTIPSYLILLLCDNSRLLKSIIIKRSNGYPQLLLCLIVSYLKKSPSETTAVDKRRQVLEVTVCSNFRSFVPVTLHEYMIIIIIIFINCNWVITRWQWLYYMYTNMDRKKSN